MSPVEVVTKNMVTISYMGKMVKKELVVPGLVRAGNAYLVQCSVSSDWTYCNEERLAKLTQKFGSIENVGTKYVGRSGKSTVKKAAAAAKAVAAPAEVKAEVASDEAAAAPDSDGTEVVEEAEEV